MENTAFLGIALLLAILAIIGFVASKKAKEQANSMGATSFSSGVALHGIPNIDTRYPVDVFILPDKINIKAKNANVDLSLEQVQAAAALKTTDLLTKDKSIIARGVVGGVILGPLGAILGGMTGIGKKKIKGSFLVINYKPKGSDDTEVIIINMFNMSFAQKLADDITSKIVNSKAVNGTIQL
ncbi:MAG TPA: hypothetical protein VE710_18415 [Candidatus Bathyarchaeia archaeon]|nr:hypothetical protein [Candidatus Bathyarchaeia archaeon]